MHFSIFVLADLIILFKNVRKFQILYIRDWQILRPNHFENIHFDHRDSQQSSPPVQPGEFQLGL